MWIVQEKGARWMSGRFIGMEKLPATIIGARGCRGGWMCCAGRIAFFAATFFARSASNSTFAEMARKSTAAKVGDQPVRSAGDAAFFVRWIDRMQAGTRASTAWNTADEQARTLRLLGDARAVFEAQAGPLPQRDRPM